MAYSSFTTMTQIPYIGLIIIQDFILKIPRLDLQPIKTSPAQILKKKFYMLDIDSSILSNYMIQMEHY